VSPFSTVDPISSWQQAFLARYRLGPAYLEVARTWLKLLTQGGGEQCGARLAKFTDTPMTAMGAIAV
jgi:hypothetical protein